jgi:hypothetical protein
MNTAERIVESYFRICRGCFTAPDIKILNGNNRQIDLLAYNLVSKRVFHVETSVTHCENWCPTPTTLEQKFDFKFLGRPKPREGKNTDYAKNKTYESHILATYAQYGVTPEEVRRVWCCWTVSGDHDLPAFIDTYCASRGLTNHPIEILSFRDAVIPELQARVGSSNYEDDVLRTFSLLREHELQTIRPNA